MPHTRVAQHAIGIIGAGIAGPVFALHILSNPTLRSLYRLTLYDQGPDPYTLSDTKLRETAGAAIGMSPNGFYPLYQLGLREDIERISTDIAGLSTWRVSCSVSDQALRRVEDAVPGLHELLSRGENVAWAEDVQSNMRAMERRRLRSVLLDRVASLGGEMVWNKRLQSLETLPTGTTKLVFEDQQRAVHHLVVGADGGWSGVRKHMLKTSRSAATAERQWTPAYCGASNVYGISTCHLSAQGTSAFQDTHGLMLDRGLLSTSPLPDGKMRWDLMVPEDDGPPPETSHFNEEWEARIAPGAYPRSRTVDLLRRHARVWHPAAGTFGRLLAASERIVHTPLRQRVWGEDEIQAGNVVAIGDSSRLMLPSSGSGSSFAVEDATVLANAILNHPPTGDEGFGNAVRQYARLRVPRSRRMAAVSSVLAKVALGSTWYWRWVRGVLVSLMRFGGRGNP